MHRPTNDFVEVVETKVLSVDLGIVDGSEMTFVLDHYVSSQLDQELQRGQVTMSSSNVQWSDFTCRQGGANVGVCCAKRGGSGEGEGRIGRRGREGEEREEREDSEQGEGGRGRRRGRSIRRSIS